MKSVLLIGLGRFGLGVAKKLNELNHQVMAVDTDEERVNRVLPYVTNAQIGDTRSEAFLRSLGVDNYDVCFVCIGEDFQSSLETTSLLKELGGRHVVARASSAVHRKFLLRNGADEVVYPEEQLAEWAAICFTSDQIRDFVKIDGEYAIYEVAVPETWAGMNVAQLDIRKKFGLNLLVVKEPGYPSAVVTPDTVFHRGQTVLTLGRWKDVQKCFRI